MKTHISIKKPVGVRTVARKVPDLQVYTGDVLDFSYNPDIEFEAIVSVLIELTNE
jgi:hypothetical protein